MSEALYERYKDALRRGHVAALRGRHAEALEAYSEAARIAPDRALPLVGIAGVLVRLGKRQEALATYDAALERAPQDEAALRGRADLLALIGDRARAAETFDRLASVLEAAGRLPEAVEAAGRALELAESRGRRTALRESAARLRDAADAPGASDVLPRAEALLERGAAGTGSSAAAGGPGTPGPETRDDPSTLGADDGATGDEELAIDPLGPPPPPFDPVLAIRAVEEAALRGDAVATRELALTAVAGHRAAGQPSTAIEACYMALALSPADPNLHLALAELYLDQGWRGLAADKLVLLGRLAELTDDAPTTERVRTLAAARSADDPRLAALAG